ncbi:MAG: hypothetical protein QM528_03010 [Phycisphaerales bacterium]|nr:hypothetical protein [Phycisphaerales bacterium]
MKKIWPSFLIIFSICISCTKEVNVAKGNIDNNRLQNSLVAGSHTGVAVGFGGYYSYTVDGGQTWSNSQVINGFHNIQALAFSSSTNGIAVGMYMAGEYSKTQGVYACSNDSGHTWSSAKNINGLNDIISVVFSSANNAVAVGDSDDGVSSYAGAYAFTSDGGQTWSNIHIIQGDSWFTSVAFSSPTNGVAVGVEDIEGVSYKGVYSYTTDSGHTWSRAYDIDGFNGQSINSVAFSSSTNGVLVGSNGTYSHTIDGGHTWSPAKIIGGGFGWIYSVAFSSPTNGVAVGQSIDNPSGFNCGLYSYTTDGGITWSNAKQFNGTYGVYNITSVSFSSASNGIAVGNAADNRGLYVCTTDSGHTWYPDGLLGINSVNFFAFAK